MKRMLSPNQQYADRIGTLLSDYGPDDDAHFALHLLLADARHWCDAHGENYAEHDRQAYGLYVKELNSNRRKS